MICRHFARMAWSQNTICENEFNHFLYNYIGLSLKYARMYARIRNSMRFEPALEYIRGGTQVLNQGPNFLNIKIFLVKTY